MKESNEADVSLTTVASFYRTFSIAYLMSQAAQLLRM